MREDIRERLFTPFLLPLAIVAVMLVFGISLSRVLLAVSEIGAALIALLAAGYILLMAFFVRSRRRIPGRALGVALAVGLIALVGAGAVASAAGMRGLEEEGGPGGEQQGGGESVASANLPEGDVFVAQDILYAEAPDTVATGDLTFVLENQGQIEHNLVIEELGNELIVEAAAGEVATGEVTLDPGEYTYYCSIPGHREAGMEGTLTADPAAESGGGGPEGGASASEGGSPAEAGASEGSGEAEPGAASER